LRAPESDFARVEVSVVPGGSTFERRLRGMNGSWQTGPVPAAITSVFDAVWENSRGDSE